MKSIRNQVSGFTLIETLVAVAVFTILMFAVNALFLSLYKQQNIDMSMIERASRAGRVLENMGKELREMGRGEDGSFSLIVTGPQELSFFSDVNSDDLSEKITYRLNSTDLEKIIVSPGDDSSYSGEGELTVVCEGVQNGVEPIFKYYDDSYSGSEDPMSYPIGVLNVKLIGINLDVNTENSRLSDPLSIETKIQLRNLK